MFPRAFFAEEEFSFVFWRITTRIGFDKSSYGLFFLAAVLWEHLYNMVRQSFIALRRDSWYTLFVSVYHFERFKHSGRHEDIKICTMYLALEEAETHFRTFSYFGGR